MKITSDLGFCYLLLDILSTAVTSDAHRKKLLSWMTGVHSCTSHRFQTWTCESKQWGMSQLSTWFWFNLLCSKHRPAEVRAPIIMQLPYHWLNAKCVRTAERATPADASFVETQSRAVASASCPRQIKLAIERSCKPTWWTVVQAELKPNRSNEERGRAQTSHKIAIKVPFREPETTLLSLIKRNRFSIWFPFVFWICRQLHWMVPNNASLRQRN